MQTKLILLAAAPAVLAMHVPRQDGEDLDLGDIGACGQVGLDIASVLATVPTPTDPAVDAFTATIPVDHTLETDLCRYISAAPAAVQSDLLSYQAAIASALRQKTDLMSTYSSCYESLMPDAGSGASIVSILTEPVTCSGITTTDVNTAPGSTTTTSGSSQTTVSPGASHTTSSPTGSNTAAANTSPATTTTTSTNAAAARETGMAALGVAAAAIVGVVGML